MSNSKFFLKTFYINDCSISKQKDVYPGTLKIKTHADVLIVCGQGVYHDGEFFSDFHDRDIYFKHIKDFPSVVKEFNYNCVVLSGGFTQKNLPWKSEAEGFIDILKDSGRIEDTFNEGIPCLLDEISLDSSENLIFGLMTARLALEKTIPIRRIGVYAAWKYKKWRFNRNAQALGIIDRTYVHSVAFDTETNFSVPDDDRIKKTIDQYNEDVLEFSLLRSGDKEEKREKRWQNNRFEKDRKFINLRNKNEASYSNRLDCFTNNDKTKVVCNALNYITGELSKIDPKGIKKGIAAKYDVVKIVEESKLSVEFNNNIILGKNP